MTNYAFSYAPELRPAFLAHMSARLDALVCFQSKSLLLEAGAITPVLSVSIIVFLSVHGPGTIADIARIDGQSHQLVKSRLRPPEALGLVSAKPDPSDDRKRILSLTAKGRADAKRILAVSQKIAAAVEALQGELKVDLTNAIMHAEKSLMRRPLSERIFDLES
ncbi:MarR family winged helix-turn-helix transcriptional regulator [Sphingorhabdus sp. EL138]|uniref:MarR family winged helix-turn-helix transcriptional regulator n=1 Tax=Sphingorhabdus sp. EL138 TaxID=2073156 RepID=UPI000D686B49|nr:MarR family winged helix-turn-helix transcriptional regulator [Sphingorhabdus sp. EL138]